MKLLAPIKDRLDAVNKGYVDDTADKKVGELRESVAKDLNTLREDLTEVEKGTIPTMDKVNIWELEAGAYYVNHIVCYATPNIPVYPNIVEMQSEKGLLYVHIDISNNTTRNFYLFANGNIYFGHSVFFGFEAQGEISSVVANIRNEITSENVDGIPTKKAVYNFGENIKTELLTNIGNKADRTEVETALGGKVNKSDILTVIDTDEVYTDNQFYNANAVNSVLNLLVEEFVTNDKFNRITEEVANKFQTKVDKSNILTEINYNVSADGIYNARVINGITQQINETFATKDYVNQAMLELFDGEDYTDAYAVLSKNPPNMLKYIGNMIGVIEN